MAKGGAKILFGLIFFVVLVAGLAAAGAWYLTEHRTEGFRATALLRLDPGVPQRAGARDALYAPAPESYGASTAPLLAPDYAVLFESDSIASQLQESLATHGDNPGMTLEQVKRAMDAKTTVALQTTNSVVYQQVVQLHFTAPTPALAETAAQTWAELCVKQDVEHTARVEQAQRDQVTGELTAVSTSLAELRDQQAQLRMESPLPALEDAARSAGAAVAELKQAVRSAQAAAARGDASLKALKAYVSKAPPAVVLELSMVEASAEAETAGAQAESAFLSGQVAEAEAAATAANAAWVEAARRHDEINGQIQRLAPQVEALEQQLAAIQSQGPSVRLASRAATPETPVGPHRYAIVAGAGILGAIAGMIVYFGLLTLRVYARELDRR